MICYAFPETTYLIYSTDIPPLLYYSHIPTAIISLLVGVFVLLNGRSVLLNRLLFAICLSFSLWLFANLILWTNIHTDLLMFSWTFLRVLSSFISVFSIYFIYVFLQKRDISISLKYVFAFLLAPVIVFAPTILNLTGFNITNCDAYGHEGILFRIYHISFGILAMFWILFLLIKHYRGASPEMKRQVVLMGAGIEFFLFSFFSSVFLVGYLTTLGVLHDSRLEMYGLFGMIVFMVFIAILIVKFRAFNAKLLSAQALMVALWFLVGSLLFVARSTTTQIVSAITLVFTSIAGYFLIRSVKREVAQREQIAKLAMTLQQANERLKVLDRMKSEFVSIASHQLRSPLTSIRGYASMLAEGSYGKLPAKAQEVAGRIAESSKYMALSVEDYLNVSRIEAGSMKYEMSDFNLRDTVEKIVDELRPVALKKGLIMVFRSDCSGSCSTHADIGKTRQVIMNLLDNAMKYTEKGTVTAIVHDNIDTAKICVTIHDTGVGMSKETQSEVFEKFVRAKNANCVNVTGTGLGLYVAKKMISDMGGRVWAESEGEGKGSTFHIELPLIPGTMKR